MSILTGINGDKSSKRLAGIIIVVGGLGLAYLITILASPAFIPLVIALETIGAGLLGSTMLERKQ